MRPAAAAASTGGFHLVLPTSHRRPPPLPSLPISSTRGGGKGKLRAAAEAAPGDASTGGFHLVLPTSHRRPPPLPSLPISSTRGGGKGKLRAAAEAAPGDVVVAGGGGGALLGRPLEDVYKVRVERGAAARARAEALRVMETWSSWRTGGRCRMPWDWHVDQLVYIVSGEVKVIPAGAVHGDDYMHFVAGDLVRYPRWFEADLYFDGPYEERYRFLAYGDDN